MRKRTKRLIWLGIFCVLVLAGLTIGAAARNFEEPGQLTLSLNGERNIYLEYGDSYNEPGAQAQLIQGDTATDLSVEIRGNVDTTQLGSYLIKYMVKSASSVRTDYRLVRVVDTDAPIILLTASPDYYTLPNTPYQEEGFSAIDNHDGDLTQQVIRQEQNGVVTYTVSDSSGNTASVTRTIRYYDPTLPKLQLQGGMTAFIFAGEAYEDPGYKVTDKYDGDLTDAVAVTGSVDPDTAGIYTVQYSVTNSFGNTATATRTIYVIPNTEEPDDSGDSSEDIATGGTVIEPNGKTIYLTFDDGPSYHTERLLDILKKYGVKVTFFVVNGSNLDMITRAAQEGHTIAIHTYSHKYSKIYASDDAFMADLEAIQQVIYEHTGQISMLTRFPGGSSNTVSSAYNKGIMTRLAKRLEEQGYTYFDWNVDSNDAGGAKNAEEVFRNVVNGVANRKNSVVLQHDTQGFSVDAVEQIIAWGLCNGYTFAPLTADSPTCHHPINN